FFFQAEDGIRDFHVTGVQTCALPILKGGVSITFKADVSKLPEAEREKAVESAREVIDRRVNLFGVSEPLIQTAIVNNDPRIIVRSEERRVGKESRSRWSQ